MSDSAIDTSEIVTSPEIRSPVGEPHPRVPSPTLVPSARPSSQDHIISQGAAAGTKANSKDAADRAHKPSIGLQNAQDQPKALDADIGPGDRSQDALKLLQELARKNSASRTLSTPAAQLDKTLRSYPSIVGKIVELNPAVRNAEPHPPARGDTNRQKARLAIAGYSAILLAGVTGLFLWSRIPAHDSERRSEPYAIPTVQARSDVPSVQTATEECDLAASKNPFATYFLMTPNAHSGNVRQAAELSREDYGWYSLMSLKARLERRGSGC